MAEQIVSSVLSVLFEKLSAELLNFATQEGVSAKLKKWERTLKMIEALLIDAEDKQLTNEAVKMWLEDLQDLAYDVEDILDEYATEALRRKLKVEEHQAATTDDITSRLDDLCNLFLKLIPACCFGFTPRALWSDFRMRPKIDGITSRLDDLCKRNTDLGLVANIPGGRSNVSQQRLPTTCLSTETAVYGREEDKAKILEMVLTHEPGGANFGVIPIVGLGGIGKTTLAQQVYNDIKVEDFNPKAWVCVSDDFDVLRISKAILELIDTSKSRDLRDLRELNAVQIKLNDALKGKKFLIVLDDVWSRSYDSWESLKAPFMAGAPGSKIIVTTRSTEVALTMRPRERYDLKFLSDGDCWEMFVSHAFNNRGTSARWNVNMIREKVVQRCKGLPLAAKALGCLLFFKETEGEWMVILNNKIWDTESNILPVLRLSYYHLPSHIKRCFAYCAILPKDYEFEEWELVLLWIAEGLIQPSSGNEELEDLGGQYFRDLLLRSVFQKSNSNNSKFIMHDLVNDLAQTVSRNFSFRLEGEPGSNNRLKIYEKTRYASHICQEYNNKRKFEVFNDAIHLRTHLSMPEINKWYHNYYISNSVVSDLLLRFKKLKVLSLQKYYIVELPNSIGGLRLLRYLNLSDSKISSLPESINSMCNLQTLILRNCRGLVKWPNSMGNLINLRHLDILGACSIEEMPTGIRKWEHLRTLSNFIVSKDSKSSLKDLKHLKFLCGELNISRLENVIDFEVTREFILSDKKDLKVLLLEWGYRFGESRDEEVEKKVLEMLRPCQNLEELTIKFYEGSKFPSWVGDRSFYKMTILKLEYCWNCTSLPSLGILDSLKSLTVKGMKGIKSIGSGDHCFKPFRSLETLCFKYLEEWESWYCVKENEGVESFPKLRELSIESCPKLSGSLPNNLCLLEKLVISKCAELVVSFSTFPKLCELNIDECKKIVCNSLTGFESLNSMSLSDISDLGNWLTQDFQRVEVFKVFEGCDEVFLEKPPQWLYSLISLRELYITNCNTLTTFEGIQKSIAHLVELEIGDCDSLTFVFRGKLPPSLKKLKIYGCEQLECLLDDNEEDSCSSSSMMNKENVNASTCHLEDLEIRDCPSLSCLSSIHQLSASLTSLSVTRCSNLTTLFSTGHLPVALKHLEISCCSNLTTLSSIGHLLVSLKHLEVRSCSELTALLPKGQLPETLESLNIHFCGKLESIVEKFHNNKALCDISIYCCQKLKSLPEGLETLSGLRKISVQDCQDFSSFPKGGFPDNNLTVYLNECRKLEALPSGIHTLSSLEIYDCPNMSLSEEGLATKQAGLSIVGIKQYQALMEWGSHNLTSLTRLNISGGWDGESIQDEDLRITLPCNLTSFSILKFPNLKYLPFKDFKDLPSLSFLYIKDCPELTSLPILPSSLLELFIDHCPSLKEACKRDKGKEWSKIADIPRVYIDGKFIYDPEIPREDSDELIYDPEIPREDSDEPGEEPSEDSDEPGED